MHLVILAATSGILAGRPAKELLDDALKLYDLRFWNEEEGLSCDTWNTEFTVMDDYRGINANYAYRRSISGGCRCGRKRRISCESGTDH